MFHKGSTEKVARFYEFGISATKQTAPADRESSSPHTDAVAQNPDKATLGDFLGIVKRENQQKTVALSAAKDAETIVAMTKDIADKGRIEEIQRRCCMLLDEKKSWEYIGAMVQLMASKESVYHKQGLLDLGADFEADLARAAKYIETCTRQLNEAIAVMKSGRKMGGKQAELARRLGQLTTSAEDSQQRLDALMTMKAMFENIGMYSDLVAAAQMWDGKTEVDAVGMALEYGMREAQEYDENSKMSVEERLAQAEAEANRKAAEEATGSLFGASFSVFSPAEASGLKALRSLTQGAKEARFRSDTLNQEVILLLGDAGHYKEAKNTDSRVVGAYGLIHLLTMRQAHGESLVESAYTAVKAIMAAVNGGIVTERSNNQRKILQLDNYACAVNMTWDGQKGAWVITGYQQNEKKSDAGARRKAMSLAEGYTPESFVRLNQVGAALDYAIARLAREHKQNNKDPRRKMSNRYDLSALSLTEPGAGAVRVKVVGKDTGNPLANSAYLVETGTPGADADGELRTKGLEGLSKEEAKERAFEQAKENIPMLKKLVAAAAKAAGGDVKMRPANKENGQETKAPSTAFSKAERNYGGDISRVVDLIGGTCVLNKESSYADAVEAIRASLPEGCSIAKVKKLGFGGNAPCYQDVKVSIRFANGGIGEVIIVDEFIQDAKSDELRMASRFLEDHADRKNPNNPNLKAIHRRIADLEIAGAVYEVKLTAKEFRNPNETNTLYMVKVESIKKKPLGFSDEASRNQGVMETSVPEVSDVSSVEQTGEIVKKIIDNSDNSGGDVNDYSGRVVGAWAGGSARLGHGSCHSDDKKKCCRLAVLRTRECVVFET